MHGILKYVLALIATAMWVVAASWGWFQRACHAVEAGEALGWAVLNLVLGPLVYPPLLLLWAVVLLLPLGALRLEARIAVRAAGLWLCALVLAFPAGYLVAKVLDVHQRCGFGF